MADSRLPSLLENGPSALFLDFDGTLVELAESPAAISVPSGLAGLLERLADRLDGRVAIVTGRPLADLDRHLGAPDLVAVGSHGAEIRYPGGRSAAIEAPPRIADALLELRRFAAAHPGVLLEEKPAGAALHYRNAPEAGPDAAALVRDVAARTGLACVEGKMVAELRPPGIDKGAAVRRLMREPPFAGARPWFVGDDLTDEDGFRAADALGGAGVLVGRPRPTAARWRLAGVAEVEAWLEAAACG